MAPGTPPRVTLRRKRRCQACEGHNSETHNLVPLLLWHSSNSHLSPNCSTYRTNAARIIIELQNENQEKIVGMKYSAHDDKFTFTA